MNEKNIKFGIDIGSTTTKVVALDYSDNHIFSRYRRHHGKIIQTLIDIISEAKEEIGESTLDLAITGSSGMGISEKLGLPFVQELVASAEYTSRFHPEARTLIDIGGEDSKIIFFNETTGNDIRMNGSCAGGTGAFIDQMVTLLNIEHQELNQLAEDSKEIHAIASRCGVFAKTDVQNLLAREIPRGDIAASIFHAVAIQIKNSLLRSSLASPKVIYSGGPLSFLPTLKNRVTEVFGFNTEDLIIVENPELIPAIGVALSSNPELYQITFAKLLDLIKKSENQIKTFANGISPLFVDKIDFLDWTNKRDRVKAERTTIKEIGTENCFLGIDSGSTTTKIVLIDSEGKIGFEFYKNNSGNPIGTVREGLTKLETFSERENIELNITASAVTGYGEDLIRIAYDLDFGIVETIAHYRAASVFDPRVTFILDIGGQDMKAIFIKEGLIHNIEINEACSSGCGSFIETFANSLNYTVDKFAKLGLESTRPCNLGTRCTVFMNSKVKQSFREGASLEDISAGLAYSVIFNCLHKVLKITDNSVLGDHIIVQGGTFRNPAIHKAFENVLGKKVTCPDVSGLMGAYGAALTARDNYKENKILEGSLRNLKDFKDKADYDIKYIHCKGCDNTCTVSKLNFGNKNIFFTGNRCEKIYTNNGDKISKGENLPAFKYKLLFDRKLTPDTKPLMTIGIPRILNLFENFPFWTTLLTECGFAVSLSDKSTQELSDTGAGTVMSDNICYPAKIAHGHILNLIEKKVDRIFYPIVTYEKNEYPEMTNCFNCPVVSGYPTVIDSSIAPKKSYNIPMDMPNVTFNDKTLLKKSLFAYFSQFGILKKTFEKALTLAIAEQDKFKQTIVEKGKEIINNARLNKQKIILLAGRPYHVDPLINHGIPEIITDFGFSVITEDAIPLDRAPIVDNLHILSQWSYPNRLYKSAKWACNYDDVEFVQLNNFGCGPDTITIDELKDVLASENKNYTLIRIDELTSTGSLKLRIRSLIESMKANENKKARTRIITPRKTTKPFLKTDKNRTILVPFFSEFHSGYSSAPFSAMGYNVVCLPPSDQKSVELGLKYVNNEICYPATLIIGDILKALKSGKYNRNEIAFGISQTGGQCRASSYLSLIKKALVKNGYADIPVIGISLSSKLLNHQPGFKLSRTKLIVQGVLGILFGDAISKMYYAIAPREKYKGEAYSLAQKYNNLAVSGIEKSDKKFLLKLLKKAVADFNNIELAREKAPKIGVVGEVYVKYNPIGNHNIVNDLVSQGIHVILPPLINMFLQWFPNVNYKHDLLLENKPIMTRIANILEKYYNSVFYKFEHVMEDFRYNYHTH
ncbi:MAG: acyl-CoA dehydratase activase-related protein, partial [Bacteroidota bacterium]